MSAVAVAVAGGAIVGSLIAADAQESAASDAAYAQQQAANQANATELQMWEQARQDFAPYLSAGQQGLYQLQATLPDYIQSTIVPIAQNYANFTPQALPGANYSINPVTGQIQQSAPPQQQYTTQQYAPQQSGQTPSLALPEQSNIMTNYTAATPDSNGGIGVGINRGDGLSTINQFLADQNISQEIKNSVLKQYHENPNTVLHTNGYSIATEGYNGPLGNTQQSPRQQSTAPAQQQFQQQQQLVPVVSQEQLQRGGVLSPNVPDFVRPMDYKFDVNDPIYQIKAKQIQDSTNAFLAKQGLGGSTAGNTYSNSQLQNLMAAEDASQYNRALTERNYLTQADIDKYNMQAQRGDTLYNRIYGQQNDLYNRVMQNTQLTNQQNLDTLARPYGVAQDLYNTMYAGATNLANMGSNAAGMTGQQNLSTGNSIANNLMSAGNAQAQSSLAQGQSQAQMWNMIGNAPANFVSTYNYMNPSQGNAMTQSYYNPSSQSNINGINYGY